ncbi:HD domain-containing protein [bacterium]|nr:HD domain-containing protein [bacterium]
MEEKRLTPEAVIALVGRAAEVHEVATYAVGGYVRDRELGLPFSGDIDFSVVGDAPAFARALAKRWELRKKVTIYKRFGTAHLQLPPGFFPPEADALSDQVFHPDRFLPPNQALELEFATSRRESYSEQSRNPEVEPAPFDEDIQRRDFTINAMAVEARDPGTILDPFDGLSDLKHHLVRTPLDPERTFDDDPLRILRAVRFASRLHFAIEENTFNAMKQHRERLKIVARERINDEFFKILGNDPPSLGLLLLFESGVLEVIFPEIAELAGVEQIGKHHHKDVFRHTLKVVDKVAERTDDVSLRFAALVHDVGKPATKRFDSEAGWTFHGHEHVGERLARKWVRKYKLPQHLVDRTAGLVRLHMRPMQLQDEGVTDSAIRRLMVQADEQLDDLLTLCRADITSGNKHRVKTYLKAFDTMVDRMEEIEQKDKLRAFQSPIRGDEIMEQTGLPEGPRVGLIKAWIEEAILEGDIPNTREGAERIFDTVAARVEALSDEDVRDLLKVIHRSRSDGVAPPPAQEND